MTNFQAHPGIAILKEVKDKDTSPVNLTQTNKTSGRIIKGEIISMGEFDTTSAGEKVLPERFGKIGDVVWFLHYYDEGGVDTMTINGQKFYAVKWGDLRAKEL